MRLICAKKSKLKHSVFFEKDLFIKPTVSSISSVSPFRLSSTIHFSYAFLFIPPEFLASDSPHPSPNSTLYRASHYQMFFFEQYKFVVSFSTCIPSLFLRVSLS